MSDERQLILLVEDNEADSNLLEEVVVGDEPAPYAFHVLRDGAKAIDFIHQLDSDESRPKPSLILLDLNLPRVSGEQVLARIRQSVRCDKVKVLVISSSDAPSDRDRAIALGATAYFRKPSSLDQFLALGPRIREMLTS